MMENRTDSCLNLLPGIEDLYQRQHLKDNAQLEAPDKQPPLQDRISGRSEVRCLRQTSSDSWPALSMILIVLQAHEFRNNFLFYSPRHLPQHPHDLLLKRPDISLDNFEGTWRLILVEIAV